MVTSTVIDKPRIVMITMFRNEATNIRAMLESCVPNIDYWVIQDNGSTDGTDEIVRQFFQEHPVPGHLYTVQEGWQGFGWNRDHLIQTCQTIDHGCDWILKMDCDEQLRVTPEFDWNLLRDISVQAWSVPVRVGSQAYYRTWLYNARLPWRFRHDPCHERVYCDMPGIEENYRVQYLPLSFHHIGSVGKGQSWQTPTKFVSDALVLEEKLLRENQLLENIYQFFYIGKSYHDIGDQVDLPLGRQHTDEYTRRAIFYITSLICHRFRNSEPTTDGMMYEAAIMLANCYRRLNNTDAEIHSLWLCEKLGPHQNNHLVRLALKFQQLGRYDDMLAITKRLIDPQRRCPWPDNVMFCDFEHYVDTGTWVQELHQTALHLTQAQTPAVDATLVPAPTAVALEQTTEQSHPVLAINDQAPRRLFVVDNFYVDPDAVRRFALAQEFQADIRWYKGQRTLRCFRSEWIRRRFESIIGQPILKWDHGMNGVFQITTAEDPQVYHNDLQTWAAMIYLTPDAPLQSGTRLHRSRYNHARHSREDHAIIDQAFQGGFYDSTKFDIVDDIGNVFNRLVIMDARHIHSAGAYFGNNAETGRLIHLFFFD